MNVIPERIIFVSRCITVQCLFIPLLTISSVYNSGSDSACTCWQRCLSCYCRGQAIILVAHQLRVAELLQSFLYSTVRSPDRSVRSESPNRLSYPVPQRTQSFSIRQTNRLNLYGVFIGIVWIILSTRRAPFCKSWVLLMLLMLVRIFTIGL